MARQPKILIADEPTANLDKLTTAEIIELLKKINDFGTTVLVSTHDESVVNTLQKRVITLKDGRIVNDQKVNGVYELSARAVPKPPVRVVQVPGHALRRPQVAVQSTTMQSASVQPNMRTPAQSVAQTPAPLVVQAPVTVQKTNEKASARAKTSGSANRAKASIDNSEAVSIDVPRAAKQSSMRKMEVKSTRVTKKQPVKMSATKRRVL